MKLKELQGIICDYVELNWEDDNGLVAKEFDDVSTNNMDNMYSQYGDAKVLIIYAMHEFPEINWLYIEIENPNK